VAKNSSEVIWKVALASLHGSTLTFLSQFTARKVSPPAVPISRKLLNFLALMKAFIRSYRVFIYPSVMTNSVTFLHSIVTIVSASEDSSNDGSAFGLE